MPQKKKQPEVVIAGKKKQPSDWEGLITAFNGGAKYIEYGANRTIFSQGDPADSLFYIRKGQVKVSVTSAQGKEAIVALLTDGDFFGEGCLAGQVLRISSAFTIALGRLHQSRRVMLNKALFNVEQTRGLPPFYKISSMQIGKREGRNERPLFCALSP